MLQLTRRGQLYAKFVELLGGHLFLAGFTLRLLHGGGRLGIDLLDLPPAAGNAVGDLLRLLLGRLEFLRSALLFALQSARTGLRFLQFFFEQAVIGAQPGQLVLFATHVGPGRLERFFLGVAAGQHTEPHRLMPGQLPLHYGELLPERDDFVAALQGRSDTFARPPAGHNPGRIDQLAMLRGKGHSRIPPAQLRRLLEIGGQRHAVEHAANQALHILAVAPHPVGRPTERSFGRCPGFGEMMAVRRNHAGAAEFMLVERLENLPGRSLVGDDDGIPA